MIVTMLCVIFYASADLMARIAADAASLALLMRRIKRYGFADGMDFVCVDSPERANQSGKGGDRRSIDYHITVDKPSRAGFVLCGIIKERA